MSDLESFSHEKTMNHDNRVSNKFLVVPIEAETAIEDAMSEIYIRLQKYGFAVVRLWSLESSVLSWFARYFGDVLSPQKSDSNGCTYILDKEKNDHIATYSTGKQNIANSVQGMDLHTDMAYLDGVTPVSGSWETLLPPEVIILACEQPAEQGGESVILDAQCILETARTDRRLWNLLTEPILHFSSVRGLYCGNRSFFELQDRGRYLVRLGVKSVTLIQQTRFDEWGAFYQDVLGDVRNQLRFKLKSKQILILDNHRILHGRGPIQATKGRVYKRIVATRSRNLTTVFSQINNESGNSVQLAGYQFSPLLTRHANLPIISFGCHFT